MQIDINQPNRPLSINEANRMHWAAKRRRLEPWRVSALAAYTAAQRPKFDTPVEITVTLTFAKRGRRDSHNYTGTVIKAIVDTLVQAGMIPDDNAEWLTVNDPVIRIDADNRCHIQVKRRPR